MAWRRPGDKPLSGPMVVSLLTHICVTRPQWVKIINCTHVDQVMSELQICNIHVWINVAFLLYLQSEFHLLGSSKIHDTIQNVNISLIIFKAIKHVMSLWNSSPSIFCQNRPNLSYFARSWTMWFVGIMLLQIMSYHAHILSLSDNQGAKQKCHST